MRLLFLLLLLANLLFLAWNAWIATPPSRPGQSVRAAEAGPNRLRLVRELPGGEVASSPPSAALLLPAADCVSAGPFLDRAAADRTAARLVGLGYEARLRSATEEVRVGQWVRVVNLASPEDAAAALAALRAAGAADAEVVGDGGSGLLVSLGVFGDAERTRGAIELAAQAGYVAEASDRMRTAEVFWLDVDRRANGSLPGPEAVNEAGAPTPELPLELRACPAQPAAGG
jgi:hypothetical protein